MLSWQVRWRPSCCRMDLTCSRAKRSLQGQMQSQSLSLKNASWSFKWQFELLKEAFMWLIKVKATVLYLSICDRYLVSKIPGVFKVSVTCPLNSRPLVVRSNKTRRTISPKYIPLVSFSNLYTQNKHTQNYFRMRNMSKQTQHENLFVQTNSKKSRRISHLCFPWLMEFLSTSVS